MELKPYWREPAPLECDTESIEERREGDEIWVRPTPCVFYPASGGQRPDRGRLGDGEVLDVRLEDDAVWLRLDGRPAPEKLRQRVDAAARLDHSEQHSGQHLLSAVFIELFGAATLSFHMGAELSTIELDIDELADDLLLRAEARAWELIRENRPLRVLYPDAEKAAAMPLRKEPQVEGLLRVIEIEGVDLSPCGGTHVSGTGALGALFIGRRERIRGRWRVEFVAGGRALRAASAALRGNRALGEILSCAPEELEERVEALRGDSVALKRTRRKLESLEAAAEATRLTAAPDWEPCGGGWSLLLREFHDRSAAALGDLAGALCSEPGRILLACAVEGDGGHLLLQRSRGEGPDLGALLKELLEGAEGRGRGGGGPDRAMGRVAASAAPAMLAAARERLLAGE